MVLNPKPALCGPEPCSPEPCVVVLNPAPCAPSLPCPPLQVNYATLLMELGELADAHRLLSTACSFLAEKQPLDAMVAALMHANLLHSVGGWVLGGGGGGQPLDAMVAALMHVDLLHSVGGCGWGEY